MLVKKLIITGLSDSFPRNATAKVSIIFLPTTILRPHFFEKHKNETSGSDPIVSFFSVSASSGAMSIKQIHAREAVLPPQKKIAALSLAIAARGVVIYIVSDIK